MRSLKSKITLVYIALVFITLLVGSIAAFNVFRLGKAIDGLMTDNYKSVNAANKMINSIEAQDRALLKFALYQRTDAIELFYSNSEEFYKWFNIARNNITEAGEKAIIDKVDVDYFNFIKLFPELQDFRNSHNDEEINNFYDSTISPVVSQVKKDLGDLETLNEKAMFQGKNLTKQRAQNSTNIILFASFIAAITGLVISIIYTGKYLRPVHLLADTIKSVKEGDLNKQTPVVYNDEIGMVATEFNNMTRRLYEFEQSTKGTLLSERNKLTTIVKSISDPLILLDSSYKIVLVNNAFKDFFHVTEETVINKHLLEVVTNSELYDYLFQVVNDNSADNGKTIHLSTGNKTSFFNATATVLRDKDAKTGNIIVLLKNVTELKQLDIIKTEFLATISHELKTPLTSVMMGVGLMLENNIGELNETQKSILEAIKEDGEKLYKLVSNLLKLSKLQSDRALFDIKPCSMEQIIKTCINNYQRQAKERKINLYYKIEKELPVIMADAEKVTWVLNNLVSNALRYTKTGDEIVIGALATEEYMQVYVRDTGKGIPEEYTEKIFERFVRVETEGEETGSTGLGLSIAREIIEAHKGEIRCESKLGEGSTFNFSIPLDDVQIYKEGEDINGKGSDSR